MELHPPLHLGVVAIEKGAFGLSSTKVANSTYFYIKVLEDFIYFNFLDRFWFVHIAFVFKAKF